MACRLQPDRRSGLTPLGHLGEDGRAPPRLGRRYVAASRVGRVAPWPCCGAGPPVGASRRRSERPQRRSGGGRRARRRQIGSPRTGSHRAEGMAVLEAKGVQSEATLPFAALHQLLRPAFGLLERLPAPQASALRAAFALERRRCARPLPGTACRTHASRRGSRGAAAPVRDRRRPVGGRRLSPSTDVRRPPSAGRADRDRFAAREGEFDAAALPELRLEPLDTIAVGGDSHGSRRDGCRSRRRPSHSVGDRWQRTRGRRARTAADPRTARGRRAAAAAAADVRGCRAPVRRPCPRAAVQRRGCRC